MTGPRSALATLMFGLAALAAPVALACAFHGYTPAPSVVARLLESRHVVLARPGPDDPLSYHAITTIRGGAEPAEIPDPVDDDTRRRLARDPADSVLFARDEMTGRWARLLYLDATMREVFDGVFGQLDDWEVAEGAERYQPFAPLHAHGDRDVRILALNELDQASYDILRGLEIEPDTASLLAGFGSADETGLQSIKILMLGLTDAQEARRFLHQGLERSAAQSTPALLGAYATAIIEAEGAEGVAMLDREILSDADLGIESRERVLEAMAIHHSWGEEPTRAAIDRALGHRLWTDRDLAAPVARQFGGYGNFTQAERLIGLLRDERLGTIADQLTVTHYLFMASRFVSSPAQ
ncbi:MAG: hypothetical protein AAF501_02885 [Pseudomonadota bacterium]